MFSRLVFFCLICVLFSQSASAYVGPGAGLGAILLAFALIAGLALLVLGFFWYPLKRLIKGATSGSKVGD